MRTILRLALLILCLGTVATAEPKEANWATVITILPTQLPTAYSTPQFNTGAARLSHVWIRNSTDQEINCATMGSTSDKIIVPAGSYWWDNLGARNLTLNGGISCIHPSSTPASGNIKIGGNN